MSAENSSACRSNVRESGETEAEPVFFEDEGSRPVEDEQFRMTGEQGKRDPRPLVVPRNDVHRHSSVRDCLQGTERPLDEIGRHPAPIEEVAPVDDEVHVAAPRGLEGALVVGEEIRSSSAPVDAGPTRPVEAEVGIREKENPDQIHRSTRASPAAPSR